MGEGLRTSSWQRRGQEERQRGNQRVPVAGAQTPLTGLGDRAEMHPKVPYLRDEKPVALIHPIRH